MKSIKKLIILSLFTFPLWGIGGFAQQSWQYALREGGAQTPYNNPNIDDQVLKIIPAIENDGSYIVVSKMMISHYDPYQSYFGDTVIMRTPMIIASGNSTIIIAKHDCDGNVLVTKQIEALPYYNHQSTEFFSDIITINNRYYLFAGTTNQYSNDTALIIDSLIYGAKGNMFIVLDENLEIDTLRYNSGWGQAPFSKNMVVGSIW